MKKYLIIFYDAKGNEIGRDKGVYPNKRTAVSQSIYNILPRDFDEFRVVIKEVE